MGGIHIPVTIRNLAQRDRAWEGLLCAGIGITDSLVPRRHLESIGLESVGQQRSYRLPDGSEREFDIVIGLVEVMGRAVGATLIIGDDDAEGLLGTTTMASAGLEVDIDSGTLKRRRSIRL